MEGAGGSGSGGGLSQAEVKYLADKVSFLEKNVDQIQKVGGAIESRMGGAMSAKGFTQTSKKFQSAVRSATQGIAQTWSQLYIFVIVLLLLFILHQVRLPLANPHTLLVSTLTRLRVVPRKVVHLD